MSAAVAVDALDHLIDEDWEWRLSDLPEFATATGDHRYDDRLDDRSVAAYQRRMNWAKDVLERVSQWEDKYGSLPYSKEITDARVSARLLTHHARGVYEGGQYHTFLCAVNRLEGPHTELPQLIDYMKFETQRDYEKYVARLRAVPQALAQVEELLRQGVTEGMLPPLVGLEGVVDQLQAVVDGLNSASGGAPPKSPLWHAAPPSVDAESARELEASALEALEAVSLSFSALRRYVAEEYEPEVRRIRGEGGTACYDLPNGRALYARCLEFHTGSRALTAAQIHSTGLAEVTRIGKEMHKACVLCGMDPAADAAGLKVFLAALKVDPRFVSGSAEEHVMKYRNLCLAIYPLLPKLFSIECMPRTPFAVVPTPAAQAEAAPSAYYLGGAGDGTRPGTFYVNCSKLPDRPFYEAEALALHEAIPGHHTQTMLAAENSSLPPFRRFMDDRRYSEAPGRYPIDGAFIEGWGLYSESLGSELGCYRDPYQLVGRLSAEMFRACRLVVDTGIHSMGWTVGRAKAFMATHTAASVGNIDAEVKRYCTWPGQAVGYKVGELEIKRLRARFLDAFRGVAAQPGCDLRAFHDCVLLQGSLPLYIIEELMEEYIQRTLETLSRPPADTSTTPTSPTPPPPPSALGPETSEKPIEAEGSSSDSSSLDWRPFVAGVAVGIALLSLTISDRLRATFQRRV